MSERELIQDVNIELGDEISEILYEASKLTHENRPGFLTEFHESFSGLRAISIAGLKDPDNLYMNLGFDGVGTKVEISERLDDHSVVAHDLFAMVCDDAVVRGAEPVAIGSILDVRQLDDNEQTRTAIKQLAEGYIGAAKAAGVVVVNGEVAELGDRVSGYSSFNYNWGAAVLWLAHKERVLTGHEIQVNDVLIGLAEHGFRSNGITDVRKAMLKEHGSEWQHVVMSGLGELSLGKLVQKPSTIYSKFITALTGGYDIGKKPLAQISGVAHITGGGQPSKLRRMLEPSGLGATITAPLDPPEIMLETQRLRGFSDKTAYGKWHMGPGMVIATPDPFKVCEAAEQAGVEADIIGTVTSDPRLRVQNRGAIRQERWLHF